ncbi:nitroreductase family protein [Streptomyces griseochromogenes]|uniref:nitroreductase family protein n=1 Tax=Streptomyces griseochromogenes TaxID=68214 RepID=UPI003791AEC3
MARRAIRAFTDEPVPRVTRERVPATSARSPSGGNLQPWRTCVVTGAPLGNVRPGAPRPGPRGRTGVPDVSADLKSPYHERRSAAAARRFGAPCLLPYRPGAARADRHVRGRPRAAGASVSGRDSASARRRAPRAPSAARARCTVPPAACPYRSLDVTDSQELRRKGGGRPGG